MLDLVLNHSNKKEQAGQGKETRELLVAKEEPKLMELKLES